MKEAYAVPLHTRILRVIMRPIFRLLFHILSQVRIIGIENVPDNGAYLLAINHVSLYEPPFILAFWPTPLEAAGAVEIWERPGQNILIRLYGGIPVHRGDYDRNLIETMLAVLKSGEQPMSSIKLTSQSYRWGSSVLPMTSWTKLCMAGAH
ncbi:MAG: 1-acyl-sn-glycerol-3-phosphate acyltransferase [Anaerolineales bacterium]